jgi:PAS domain S-box-containing protein
VTDSKRLSLTDETASERMLEEALDALAGDGWAALDRLVAPAYVTDAEGKVTYWNRACVQFAGREPELGRDRWCVTWKLYTTGGDPLPHHACPMAVALKEQRAVRDTVAIAERPDGSRRAFKPYPTPLFDASGRLTGAVNLLVDVTAEQGRELRAQAERCRRLAKSVNDSQASRVLDDMAIGYENSAASLAQG